MAFLATFFSKTIRDRQKSAVCIFKALFARNPFKKIPTKLNEK